MTAVVTLLPILAAFILGDLLVSLYDAHRRGMQRLARARYTAEAVAEAKARIGPAWDDDTLTRLWAAVREVDR